MNYSGFGAALASFARPHARALWLGALFMSAETMVSLTLPWLGGRFAGDIFDGRSVATDQLLLLLGVLFTGQALLQVAAGYMYSRRSALVLADIRIRLYDHIQSLPVGYFQQRQQGRILSILSDDVAMIGHYLSSTVVSFLPMALTLAGSMVMMFTIDTTLAMFAVMAVPLFYVLVKLFGREIRPLSNALQEAHAQAFAVEEENLQMLPAIKSFTREPIESARYGAKVDEITRLKIRQQWIEMALGPGVFWLAAMGALVLLWFAGGRIASGGLGKGELVSFLLYATLLARPVSAFAGAWGQTQHAKASMARMLEIFQAEPERNPAGAPPLQVSKGSVSLRSVSFAYPGRQPVFEDFNLDIAVGETLALTGENGAGKSTLIALIMRLVEPQSGQVLIDGQDVSRVELASLRRQIAIVPQHVFLFNGTVRENIGFGRAGATEDEIRQAARLAQAHDFIQDLPSGYETTVGDQGVRLSGGQRQRLALARALLKDPAILILDEATSMFDPAAELDFLRDCAPVFEGRTVILVTHRPASLALATRILRLDASGASTVPVPAAGTTAGSGPMVPC